MFDRTSLRFLSCAPLWFLSIPILWAGPLTSAQLAVDIAYSEPVDLPGFTVVTFSVDSVRPITSIGADFDGPMNQVNPEETWTVFNDINPFFEFYGAHPTQDSHFQLSSTRNNDAWMMSAFGSESEINLEANLTLEGAAPFGSALSLAQIVIPNDTPGLQWEITIVDDHGNNYTRDGKVTVD